MQYVIQKTYNKRLFVRWDGNVIVFDTKEEVKQHIKENYYFFKNAEYQIIPKLEYFTSDYIINYKDIVDTDRYRDSCVYKA